MSKITLKELEELRYRLEDKIDRVSTTPIGDPETKRLTELCLRLMSELVERQIAEDRYSNTRFP